MLEATIEDAYVLHAAVAGVSAIKCEVPGWRNWPDRFNLIGTTRQVFFIEFKRPGEEPSPGQYYRHSELRKLGHHVYWCDNFLDAYDMLQIELLYAQTFSTT